MDLATAEGARARYARVCVEVDLSKPLLRKYMIGDRVFYVEYESLENICHSCGIYGHKIDACLPPNSPADVPPPEAGSATRQPGEEKEDNAGSWMTVTRRCRPKKSVKVVTEPPPTKGSRFNILQRPTPDIEKVA
ncbi:hypothetical protein LINPERHAP2_LOCUS10929 [Linum perenne]